MNDEEKTKIDGKLTIPNLSEENDLDEIELTVTVDESNDKSETLKQFMYNNGRNKIREQIGKYITSLKNDYAKNLILPKKDAQVKSINQPTVSPALINFNSLRARQMLLLSLIKLPPIKPWLIIQYRRLPISPAVPMLEWKSTAKL